MTEWKTIDCQRPRSTLLAFTSGCNPLADAILRNPINSTAGFGGYHPKKLTLLRGLGTQVIPSSIKILSYAIECDIYKLSVEIFR